MATFLINSPKFGALNFEGADASARVSSGNDATYAVKYNLGGEDYYFVPETYVLKGVVNNNKQLYSQSLLNRENLNRLYSESELVDLGPDINNPASKLGSKGFLMNPKTYKALFSAENAVYDLNKKVGKARVGEITGLSEINGNLVYSAKAKGGSDKASAWIQPPGTDPYDGKKVKSGEIQTRYIEGGPLYSFGKSIAGVPFLPEIAGFVTGNPYVYATAKGLSGGASGKDPLRVGLETGATIVASNLLSDALSAPTPVGGTPGVSEVYPVDMGYTAPGVPIPPSVPSGLPPIDLLGGTTFPGQGIQVPSIDSSRVALLPEGTLLPGEGLTAPTMPGIPSMGMGTGLTVGVPGGTVGELGFTQTGAVPVLGDTGSFINDPAVLGRDVLETAPSTISLSDAFRAARAINSLMGGGQPQPSGQPVEMGRAQPTGISPLDLMRISISTPDVAGLLSQRQPRISPRFNLLTGEPLLPSFSLLG